ncbi:2-oxoisovalerate dehydrogenase E2 component (dihydrolipoyl transacylase) [Pseudomonas sp. PvR086]|jgi:2-oxoisovalerate dehydrogenase E2 component (dihydrolipoyl transacylase)|uniref:dihydrolipoamide acetyltransferase family protein n=1 Tax=Pseudomonas TaxID=286 RepID=UPI000B35F46E|nr:MULTISPECIES: dihydrolipoamide acetyltransferase family protein [Pseudomonas]MBD9609227.1 2-oxo acid dehydrogenase subunit E2 [Pseudomonas sp. PDM08]MDR7108776.1 2-oxoisovalerate dehydrogenase E2 component (dihydrolipoyl transacylase) [Pseudomonas frederiksbergensis]PMY50955.1 2-oxo acid dehydrogenase subunit E2 [Pseudomonas sp. FW305-53]PMY84492.1 2-oxo acid dehydrogenase subunit E2 [Pseudomonas sp. FW303-C2]PMY92003.1 2-oxo acid dehydrogenase subunit E2 [Pseudomonas sp. FW305-62]
MGTHVIKMPDIGEGIAEVELSQWHVKVGDMVVEDQVLADVMTDKAMVDIPSPVNGKVIALGGQPGEVMAVGSVLISIEVEGAGNVKESTAPAAVVKEAPVAAPNVEAVVESAPAAAAPRPAAACQGPMVAREADERPLASPAVRKHALDLGIQLRLVRGSGPAGRILHEDLEAYLAQGQSNASTATAAYAQRNDEQQIPVIGMRRKIAQRMQDATQRAAHFSYVEEIDVTAVEELRAHLNEKHGATRGKLTLLPFLVRALVVALRDFPQINARYDDEAQVITRLGAVHVGVATQADIGLMVPVVRHAEARSLWDNAAEISRLATAARTGKASRDELSGSTITLTSLGALGGIVSTPVLNLPEVAIVGVNKIVERPMVIKGQIVIRKMMNLSSSFDHRVVDGMDAAQFIQAVRGLLEQPATLFVE